MISSFRHTGAIRAVVWMCGLVFASTNIMMGQMQQARPRQQDTVRVLPFTAEVAQEKKENDKTLPQEEIDRLMAGTRGFESDRLSTFSAAEQSKIMQQIAEYAGVPYEVGGNSKGGVDCGSFVALVYRNAAGMELPAASVDQFHYAQPIKAGDGHFGDLVFFNTTGRRGSHVGIYLGNQLFAHASVSIGVTISTLESSYYKKRYEGVRRLPR